MCLNRSFAHARAVMNGLLTDVSASDGACTSPAHKVPLLCCRLVKFALKEPDFRHQQCHHSTYIYSLLVSCILKRV